MSDLERWDINLEEPYQRPPLGLDTRNNHLDVVCQSDLATPRGKDAADLDKAVALGSLT